MTGLKPLPVLEVLVCPEDVVLVSVRRTNEKRFKRKMHEEPLADFQSYVRADLCDIFQCSDGKQLGGLGLLKFWILHL